MHLDAEPPKALTGREECDLLRLAISGGTASRTVVLRLASLLNRLDAFDECVELLQSKACTSNFESQRLLLAALFARAQPDDLKQVQSTATSLLRLANSPQERAFAMTGQAKAKQRLGDTAGALPLLHSALEADPTQDSALRRLAYAALATGGHDSVLTLSNQLLQAGVHHAQLLASRAQALAQSGNFNASRALISLETGLKQATLPCPAGWPSLEAFHARIAHELLTSPGLRHGRHGTASFGTLRVDEPVTVRTPALRILQQHLLSHLRLWIGSGEAHQDSNAAQSQHPDRVTMRLWCVITQGRGHENWHMHPQGWMSGGYYVEVPQTVVAGDSAAGCLEFGLPDLPIGRDAAIGHGTTLLRPRPGLLSLFPSQAYHRTHPHGADGRRICLAFDLVPA